MAFSGGAQAPAATAPKPAARAAPKRRPVSPAARKVAAQRQRKPSPRGPAAPRPRVSAPAPLYDPAQALVGPTLKRAATALTDLEINPQVSTLARQVADNNRQGRAVQTRLGGYFDSFGDVARDAITGQQTTTDRLGAALASIGAQTQGTIAGAGQQAAAATQPAADRGLDGGALAQLAAETAAQRQRAAQESSAAQTFGATQGANYEGLTGTMPGVAALRGTEALRQTGNAFAMANREPNAKIAELEGSRGSILTKNIGALRDSERNYGLARDTLGLDAQKSALGAQQDAADRRQRAQLARLSSIVTMRGQDITRMIADRTFRLNVQKTGYEQAAEDYMREHGLGPYKPAAAKSPARPKTLSPGQVNSAWSQVDAAKSAAVNLRTQYGLNSQQIRQALTTGSFVARDEAGRAVMIKAPKIPGGGYGTFANTALDLAENGYISTANVRALHRAGLKIGSRYQVYRPLPPTAMGPSRPG